MKPKAKDKSTQKSKTTSRRSEKQVSKSSDQLQHDSLRWMPRVVKLTSLTPFERNPRRISKEAFEKLVSIIKEDGYHQRIIATQDLRIVGGHQRLEALKKLKIKEIEILTPDRELTDEEFRRIIIRDNLPFGEFDMDILSADYERDELVAIGMPESFLPGSPDFEPSSEDEQGKLDEKEPVEVQCPNCQHVFNVGDK